MSQQYQKQKKKWYDKGRLDRDKEILEMINKWVVGVNDKGIILEIKKQLTKEEQNK